MGHEGRVVLVLVVDEVGRVVLVLDQPAAPEVADALLVSGGADDAQRVQVDGLLDDVGGRRRVPVDEDRIPLEEDVVQEVVEIIFAFDSGRMSARNASSAAERVAGMLTSASR